MPDLLTNPSFLNALLVAAAMGSAAAVLSVIVILRRWAFIGEGIAHAGFGGIGTAWLLSLLLPALADHAAVYAVGVLFCLGTALAIGFISRSGRVNGDAAIGIFLVASIGWGVVALSIFQRIGQTEAPDWERYLMGDLAAVSAAAAWAVLCLSAAILLLVGLLRKEILAYCLDPTLAAVSGVRTGLIHYLLMLLLALVIVLGMGIAGNLLVPALLILPGATALLLSQRLATVVTVAITVSLIGTVAGLLLVATWDFIPPGPAMVLVLFVEFVVAFGGAKITARVHESR